MASNPLETLCEHQGLSALDLMQPDNLRAFLDQKVLEFEHPDFIAPDPISIPHRYSLRQDIEVTGLLAATIAWGNRKAIVAKAGEMADRLGADPYDFVMSASESQIEALGSFVYRTFQQEDLPGMVRGLRAIYTSNPEGGLEELFAPRNGETLREGMVRFREAMVPHLAHRTHKHIANVAQGAAGKRLCMFLRWMVRSAARGVDFGLWNKISPAQLVIPLDVHSARTGRALGLLQRKQNDWAAALELTEALRQFCPEDPVKYDLALFSLSINGF